MHIIAYRHDGRDEVGRLDPASDRIVPFDLAPVTAAAGLLALLDAEGYMPAARDTDAVALDAVTLRAPVPLPRRNVFCIGKNYYAHVQEIARRGFDTTGGGAAPPEHPIVFSKLPQCVIAHCDPIVHRQSVVQKLDYEAELGVIIGRGGRGIRAADALDHVWGYTIINDVTARDLQQAHKQWLIGKSQDGFCPMGPVAVTRDELDLASTPIRCYVNDELRQDSHTGLMMFDVPHIIEALSAGITLQAGDVIASGTPSGVGAGFDPPKFLQAGDVVRIEIPPIGRLENRVVSAD